MATLTGVRVLVVDDEEPLRDLLKLFLESKGAVVLDAGDGRTALRRIEDEGADLILCDQMMPGITGQELFRKLAQNRPDFRGRFILMTGSVDLESGILRPDMQMVRKPFDLAQIEAACLRCIA